MNNLLKCIKLFKLARLLSRKPAEAQGEINGLVKMYEAIGAGNTGLKQDFSKLWDKLPDEKRSELVKRLLAVGLLPYEVGYALEIFNGTIVSLI